LAYKISVITPSFNQAQFLPFNLESVRAQSHGDVEHIVVDPGSKDGSLEIARDAEHIRLIDEPDRGQSDGITKGFERSTGDILTWLNSDDFYPSDEVLALVAKTFRENPDVDIVYGRVNFVDEQGEFLKKGFINSDAAGLLTSFPYQVGIVQPGVFTRRSVFEKVGGPSEQYEYCMDYEYWVRMASAGFKWKFLDETLAHHRWWDGMKTSKGRDASLVEHMRVSKDYFGYIHWKWLDRYADYIVSNADGVVNYSGGVDPSQKNNAIREVVLRYVSQEMMAYLQKSSGLEEADTLLFINRHVPDLPSYYQPADALQGLKETHSDPDAHNRTAWHIMNGKDDAGKSYKTYNVPDNFHRCFDADWFGSSLAVGKEKLARMAATKKSDVCVIVANGPSLNKTDFSLLENVDVIISNFATLNPKLLDLASIITITNTLVAEQGGVSFNDIRKPKVMPIWLSHEINQTAETCFVEATVNPEFCDNLDGVFSWRSTVSYFNMQLAYALGYKKVLLVGFDNSYAQPKDVKEGDLIKQDEDDDNHFDPRYFKNRVWQAADTNNMAAMYEVAKAAYQAGGREIINCTVGGKLEVFQRGDLSKEMSGFAADIAPSADALEWAYETANTNLTRFENTHKAQRCFIIADDADLSPELLTELESEITFSNNAKLTPNYLVLPNGASKPLAADSIEEALNDNPEMTGIIPQTLRQFGDEPKLLITRDIIPPAPNRFYFKSDDYFVARQSSTLLSNDPATYLASANSPILLMIQLANHMGCSEIYLIGSDTQFGDRTHAAFRTLKSVEALVYDATPQQSYVPFPAVFLDSLFLLNRHDEESAPEGSYAAKKHNAAIMTLTEQLPQHMNGSIFLPTNKVRKDRQLSGIQKVVDLYANKMDAHSNRLKRIKAAQTADRCFIIGNGPSLNETDLSKLEGEVTFAVNGFFLKAAELNWNPTFFVVEDHLVAEDRAPWLNAIKTSEKLFPAYLAYCCEEDENTTFFNHRPRPSHPDGFDFSLDASDVTFTGCTVTFTCMQLAAYMGFKEIYLIGVDASYKLPDDTVETASYGTTILDMESDDPNHFHPDYFGKGYRWHDPQTDKMIEAYAAAREALKGTGSTIYNATVGGELEVFERKNFDGLFEEHLPRVPEPSPTPAARTDHPRLLVFDLTPPDNGTATGEIKTNIFADWPGERYLQIFSMSGNDLGLTGALEARMSAADALKQVRKHIEVFNPDLILYRPVPDASNLHHAAMDTIKRLADVPLVTWIMDDWPTRLGADDPEQYASLNIDWLWLLDRSNTRLSIGTRMSTELKQRYGFDFIPFANGVSPDEWAMPAKKDSSKLTIRYAGALANNMCAASILRVAQAVEELANEGHPVELEIRTGSIWQNMQASSYKTLKHTKFFNEKLSREDYRKWLQGAGAVLVGYNFDEESLRYIRLSMANKIPECLASGAPLLAHGPLSTASIEHLDKHDCAKVVSTPEIEEVKTAILSLLKDTAETQALVSRAQQVAFTRHNICDIRKRFADTLIAASQSPPGTQADMVPISMIKTLPRDKHAQVDETAVVAHLLADRKGREFTMIDVGAHVGSSADYFDRLGWSIHCFEPDPNNRKKLIDRFGSSSNVIIDTRAVSDKPATGLQFFSSEESTGISGLHAFRDTHAVTATVDATTVEEIVEARSIDSVDFLKIDVEGFDLNVLKGVPWNTLKPDVVECEFEDGKTLRLGHDWKAVGNYLKHHGYTVYVSEWHPIVRYGIAHDWKRVVPFEQCEMPGDAWGNFVAFRRDPGYEAVSQAFDAMMKFRKAPVVPPAAPKAQASSVETPLAPATKSPKVPVKPTPDSEESRVDMLKQTPDHALSTYRGEPISAGNKWYSEAAHKVRAVSPGLFALLRFTRRALVHLFTRPALLIGVLIIAGLVTWFALGENFATTRGWWFAGAGGALLTLLIAYIAQRAHAQAEMLQIKATELQQTVTRLQKDLKTYAHSNLENKGTVSDDVETVVGRKVAPKLKALTAAMSEDRARFEALYRSAATTQAKADLAEKQLQKLSGEQSSATHLKADLHKIHAKMENFKAEMKTLDQSQVDRHAETRRQVTGDLNGIKAQLTQFDAAQKQISDTAAKNLQTLSSGIAEVSNKLAELETARIALQQQAGDITSRVDAIAASDANTVKQIVSVQALLEKQSTETETLGTGVTTVTASVAALEGAFNEAKKWTQFDNNAWFQHFNRQLKAEHVTELEQNWRKRLSIPIAKATLGYMAGRACDIERALDGRLATSVEDVLLRTLVASAVKSRDIDVLEIGTLFGTGAAIMFDSLVGNFDQIHFTLLDPLQGYYNGAQADILTGQIVDEGSVRRNLQRVGMQEDQYTLIQHLSTEPEAMVAASKRKYDLLVIDGDHSYAGVKTDFENYAKFVKVGGYIIFDDYNSPDWPEVTEYVDAEMPDVEFISRVGHSWRTCVYRVVKDVSPSKKTRSRRKPTAEKSES
jgi:FkbM family methyltransferase